MKIDCETSEYNFLMNNSLENILYMGIELHFHMGKSKWDELVAHIKKTHHIIKKYEWRDGVNREVFCINKRKTSLAEQLYYRFLYKLHCKYKKRRFF